MKVLIWWQFWYIPLIGNLVRFIKADTVKIYMLWFLTFNSLRLRLASGIKLENRLYSG